MRSLPVQTYLTADQLDEQAKEREAVAHSMPPGAAKQSVLKEAMQLRSYANMKRLLGPPRKSK